MKSSSASDSFKLKRMKKKPSLGPPHYKGISHRKLLMKGMYRGVKDFILVDCRFPYEFEAGTIRGAINIHKPVQLRAFFFTKPFKKDVTIVFFSEYSSNRGPKMYGMLRKFDRKDKEERWPDYPHVPLSYPQILLLEGGYRRFFHYNSRKKFEFCEPDGYVEMEDSRFVRDRRRYSA